MQLFSRFLVFIAILATIISCWGQPFTRADGLLIVIAMLLVILNDFK